MSNINVNRWRISRRTMLRGLGAAIALPQLECMASIASPSKPRRSVFLYIPNGVNTLTWQIQKAGADYALLIGQHAQALGHPCLRRGRDAVDRHADFLQLARRNDREGGNAGLRGAVVRLSDIAVDARGRGRVDDAALGRLAGEFVKLSPMHASPCKVVAIKRVN